MSRRFLILSSIAAGIVIALIWRIASWQSELVFSSIISGIIGAVVGSIGTIWLVRIAHVQLSGISNTNDATFVFDLKRDFFKEETRRIVQLLDMGFLRFFNNENLSDSYFIVDQKLVRDCKLEGTLKKWLLMRKTYSTYEIDDLLLGHMEDVGMLVEKKIVRVDLAYEEFSYYVELAWENAGIQEYIERQRREYSDIYDKLEALYTAFEDFENQKGVRKGKRS